MSSRARLLLAVVLGVTVLILSSVGLAAATVLHRGTIRMEIDELGPGGDRYDVTIPATLVDLAIDLVPDQVIADATHEVAEALQHPAAGAVAWKNVAEGFGDALLECPDAVFVEVRGTNEHVLIEKRGNKLIIRVEDSCQRVHISVPIATLVRAAEKLTATI